MSPDLVKIFSFSSCKKRKETSCNNYTEYIIYLVSLKNRQGECVSKPQCLMPDSEPLTPEEVLKYLQIFWALQFYVLQ